MTSPPTVSRAQVIAFRWRAHQLDRPQDAGESATDADLLDLGLQDTGTGGAAWALANRGVPAGGEDDLALVWTIRGAPHVHRRADLPLVAHATAPLSEADAGKRIYGAYKPLKAAGITAREALATVAERERSIVTVPTVKGDLSTRLTRLLDEPYLRFCRPCNATHAYEMPFRLAALQAGLELEPGTSPPVLRRVHGLEPPLFGLLGGSAEPRVHVVRNYLRFFGPARPRDVATFLDAPVKAVKEHWPEDAVPAAVPEADGDTSREPRYVLEGDLARLTGEPEQLRGTVRLLGPYDPYLQLKDREILARDAARSKDLWRAIGRPGAVVVDGEVVGTWRPRAKGGTLGLAVAPWTSYERGLTDAVAEQAERYATHRGLALAGVDAA